MHPIYLQSISTAKFLFEEERRTTTLDSAGCHDCNSITKNIGLLMVIVIKMMSLVKWSDMSQGGLMNM